MSWENWIDINYTTDHPLWCLREHLLLTAHYIQLAQHKPRCSTLQVLITQHNHFQCNPRYGNATLSLINDFTRYIFSDSTIILNRTQGVARKTLVLINYFTIWTITHCDHPECNIGCRDVWCCKSHSGTMPWWVYSRRTSFRWVNFFVTLGSDVILSPSALRHTRKILS